MIMTDKIDALQQENALLKKRIEELENEVKALNTPREYSAFLWGNNEHYAHSEYEALVGRPENEGVSHTNLVFDWFKVEKISRMRMFSPRWGFLVPDSSRPSGVRSVVFRTESDAEDAAEKMQARLSVSEES